MDADPSFPTIGAQDTDVGTGKRPLAQVGTEARAPRLCRATCATPANSTGDAGVLQSSHAPTLLHVPVMPSPLTSCLVRERRLPCYLPPVCNSHRAWCHGNAGCCPPSHHAAIVQLMYTVNRRVATSATPNVCLRHACVARGSHCLLAGMLAAPCGCIGRSAAVAAPHTAHSPRHVCSALAARIQAFEEIEGVLVDIVNTQCIVQVNTSCRLHANHPHISLGSVCRQH